MNDDTSKDWFFIALEFRSYGYSLGEMICAMVFALVALSPDALTAIRAAYRTTIGRDE